MNRTYLSVYCGEQWKTKFEEWTSAINPLDIRWHWLYATVQWQACSNYSLQLLKTIQLYYCQWRICSQYTDRPVAGCSNVVVTPPCGALDPWIKPHHRQMCVKLWKMLQYNISIYYILGHGLQTLTAMPRSIPLSAFLQYYHDSSPRLK